MTIPNVTYLIAGILLIYIPLHLFEEAMGGFPKWMRAHRWTPDQLSYGHWMANNLFFYYPLLILCFAGYYFGGVLFLGSGILFWGLINSADHIIYTIIDRKVSPGLFSGLLFAVVSILGLISLQQQSKLNGLLILFSVLIGLVDAFLPILLSMKFHKQFKKEFS